MEIRKGKVVALDYRLADDSGKVIDKSGKTPLYYLHGHDNIVSGLEEALEGRRVGDAVEVSVPAEKGYGTRDPKLVTHLPLNRLPEGVRAMKGQRFSVQVGGRNRTVTVTRVRLNDVEIDANHPLADQTLHFQVRVRKVRDATPSELSHRHAHAPKPGS